MTDIYLIDDDVLVNFLNREMIHAIAPNSQIEKFEVATNALYVLRNKVAMQDETFPSWIFLDINMPFMDGWEFLDQYARFPVKFREKTKICLLSSSIDKHDVERSNANPFVFEYLVKPLSDEQLIKIGLTSQI